MPISEVFEGIQLEDYLMAVTDRLLVEKLTGSETSKYITIHMTSEDVISFSYIKILEKKIEEQFFRDSGKSVRIQIRFLCIEECESEQAAWNMLKDVLIQDYRDQMLRFYEMILKNAESKAEHGTIRILLPNNAIYSTMSEDLSREIITKVRYWSDRFTGVQIDFEESEDLTQTYAPERTYSEEEYIAKLQRSRMRAQEAGNRSSVPKDLVKRVPKEEPAEKTEKPAYQRRKAVPQDPNFFYGRAFDISDTVRISELEHPYQEFTIQGRIFKYEERELVRRDETPEEGKKRVTKTLVSFNLTDFTDSIAVKMYVPTPEMDALREELADKKFVILHGETEVDKFTHELTATRITGIRKGEDFRIKRKDLSSEKRVELHCHTQMSDMDAVAEAGELVKTAFAWGHPGIAITDHGVVQSFVDAFHAIDPKKFADDPEKTAAFKKFKIIYGMEGYLVDDEGTTKPDGTPFNLEEDKEEIKKLPYYHIILLCKNDVGRINLYRMVSKSHIEYFYKGRPRIPKSLLRQYREGLIIGSACEAGELFRAVLFDKPEEEIKRIGDFYDYYEIQPVGNNGYMIDAEDIPQVKNVHDLEELNRKIVDLADKHGKMCVATCDVHFLNDEDEVYRRIIMSGKGFKDADKQPPLYYRTTDEMLDEFTYLPEAKAYEIVVTNPNRICRMIEKIEPVRPDKCPPVIENSENELRDMCYNTAHSWYGENLPVQVEQRLEKELNSIIKNGFSVMYIIAQRLVKHSNDDGYLVGSRGSVGSSFVATMSGITEVNPLPAHYYCKHCHYYDFDSDEVQAYSQMSGFDLPDKECPVCGKPLTKDGQNIPFETFLGFNGDKEPDIDLNFSSEYQSKAHAYTEVLFGKGHTFRAGTVGTVADNTAFGYIKKYYEEHGIAKRTAELDRLVGGCVGVRRSTGQHPGGIIVLPHGEEIDTFTPIQRPANDMTTETITTHFDYHKIDHNLLKLDILGHEDPTMIRMLEDLTGLDAKKIPMDDPKVLSLLQSTEALGIKPEDIDGCELGSLGLPELGTNFTMKMLKETKPKSFSDMIRISGLSHGTDVWTNNTQDLIAQGKCTLATAICTRDDIMVYLIHMGIENGQAFKIMESVRKGRGLKPEMEETMLAHNVPDWYIWSCKQIKYMFPKAHACAYVMMSFRVAYCKVYYPLAYYTAYFTIRATNFDYQVMAKGRDKMETVMKEFIRRSESKNKLLALSDKEEGMLKDMRIVQEMYARGFEFLPIDIYRAKATKFQIIDGKIMPSLSSIDGMGVVAATSIEENAKGEPFLSKEEIRIRCHVGASITNLLTDVGVLDGMQESNQMSLNDFFGGM